jgi:hypothetical protein
MDRGSASPKAPVGFCDAIDRSKIHASVLAGRIGNDDALDPCLNDAFDANPCAVNADEEARHPCACASRERLNDLRAIGG